MSTLSTTNLKNSSSSSNNIVLNTDGTIGGSCLTQTCRAWVNFNGTGTVAIRASYNVSSITDNGTGDYTVNFTNALADANYSVVTSAGQTSNSPGGMGVFSNSGTSNPSTTAVRVFARNFSNNPDDFAFANVAIFR